MSLALLPSWTQHTISSWRAVIADKELALAGAEDGVARRRGIAPGDAPGWFMDMEATH